MKHGSVVAAGWAVVCACVLSTSAAAASDWPQFRGPARDGQSTEKGLLQAWPEGGPKLLWTASGLGKGFTSASIARGRIYV